MTPHAGSPLADWLAYLEAVHPTSIDFGLERVSRVRDALGIRFDCPVFTVGGTNGKGSTCAFLEGVLMQAGYRVGLHTSPHLIRFNERARIGGEPASDELLVRHLASVDVARRSFDPPVSLTYFEFSLLAFLLAFQDARLDAVILEVGLGGRLDAVNCIDADCAIVTSIDIDHREYLGDTREAIAFEKAHIFRAGRPAVCSDPRPPAPLVDYAATIGADLWLFGRDFNYAAQKGPQHWQQWSYGGRSQRIAGLAYPALRGANQLLNASAALAALEAMRDRLPVPAQAIRTGLALVELPGRFQVLPGQPTLILDVAHNPHAAAALADNLDHMAFHPVTHAVFGCMRDKDALGIVSALASTVDHWYLSDLPPPRGATAAALAATLAEAGVRDSKAHRVSLHATPAEALEAARSHADQADRILVFGSFVTVGQAMMALHRERQ